MLSSCLVGLILHFEHDRHIFVALSIIAEDKVALATLRCIVVLLEVGARHSSTQILLELSRTVLLQRFANHLGRETRLEVLVEIHLLLFRL